MIVRFAPTGSGVNKDLSAHELPRNVWTDANNIRFLDGLAHQALGYSAVYDPPSVVPYHLVPLVIGGERYLVYAGTGKIYCVTGSTHTDLTRAAGGDYAGAANAWTSTVFGGIPILNDGSGANYPQYWNLNTANNFGDLTNWPANTYCKSIRAYRNFLVALNVTETTTNYPYRVKWSHPADPGSLPATWDETNAAYDAGEVDLHEGQDAIVDGLALRDSLIIYKENSVWRMTYTGGLYVHKFEKVLGTSGALTQNCITEIDGRHFVLTNSDVIVHDGFQPISILDKATRRQFFADLDDTYYGRAFTFKMPFYNEACVAYPAAGSSVCNKLMVWNWVDNTVSFRDLPNALHAVSGLVDTVDNSWAGDAETWADDTTTWDQAGFTPDSLRTVVASSSTKLHVLDSATDAGGTAINGYLERRGLSFGDPDAIKLVRWVKPRIRGIDGETVTVKVGYADSPYDDPTYTSSTYTIGTTNNCDFLVAGRYIAIKFETGSATQWRLDSFDVDVVQQGKY